MALQAPRTDPKTLAAYPAAYIRINNISLTLMAGGTLDLGVYATKDAADEGGIPIPNLSGTITLTDDEAAFLREQGLALLYGVLKSRTEFAEAADV